MANFTPNVNLEKPLGSERYLIPKFNANMDKIDMKLGNKVDKSEGKGLSSNDYTSSEKEKLLGIQTGANNYIHPATHLPSIIEQDENNRFVTDAEKAIWNAKQAALVSGTNIKTVNGVSILASGDVELLPKHNPVATGTQTLPSIVTNAIKFPATQVPSADANTLDDYEEGVFTPIIIGETINGVGTYVSQTGAYIKIGKLVYIFAHIKISSHTGSGSTMISGLPFTVTASGTPFSVITDSLDFEDAFKYITTYSTGIQLYLAGVSDAGPWGVIPLHMDTAFEVRLSGSYITT